MKKLILLALPLLLISCGVSQVTPVDNSTDTKIEPVIAPTEETKTEEKPQREILAKPEPITPKNTETEAKTDEMTQEIDRLIDDLISDL